MDKGTADALVSTLVQQHNKRLEGFANRMLNDKDDAQDVACEVWEAAVRRVRGIRGAPNDWQKYLFGIAHKRAAKKLRERGRQPAMVEFNQELHNVRSSNPYPASDARLELRRMASNARDAMSIRALAAAILQDEGFSDREIAAILKIKANNVASTRQRGLLKLRENEKPTPPPATNRPRPTKG